MKKLIITTFAIACISGYSENASAQWSSVNANDIETDPTIPINNVFIHNYLGIGTNTGTPPQYRLTVSGDIGFEQSVTNRHIHGNTDGAFAIYGKTTWSDGSGIMLTAKDPGNPASGEIALLSTVQPGSSHAFRFVDENWNNHMTIDGNSNVNINGSLQITGDYTFAPITNNRHFYGKTDGALAIYSKDSWSNGSGIVFNGTGGNTTVDIVSNATGSNPALRLVNSSWHPKMVVDGNGNIEAGGNYTFRPDVIARSITGNTTASLGIYSKGANWNEGSAILLSSGTSGAGAGLASFFSTASSGNLAFRFTDKNWNHLMTIDADGQVSIGGAPTVGASSYKLYVATGILTEKVKVALSTDQVNWSDFVFADDYQLKPLAEVEEYVKENKHLPEIPSAEEVYKNGLDLAQMDAKLLQKIEELTLYVIQQNKKIEELENRLSK